VKNLSRAAVLAVLSVFLLCSWAVSAEKLYNIKANATNATRMPPGQAVKDLDVTIIKLKELRQEYMKIQDELMRSIGGQGEHQALRTQKTVDNCQEASILLEQALMELQDAKGMLEVSLETKSRRDSNMGRDILNRSIKTIARAQSFQCSR